MAALIKFGISLYKQIIDLRDPRTDEWFLAGSIFPILGILIAYWWFVFRIGPKFMEHRKPFQLDTIMQVYNLVQVLLCSYLVLQGLLYSYGPWGTYNWACEPIDFSNTPDAVHVAACVHGYYLIKVLDLMDTVFFVLRKKQSQVSFLHVYHHMGMAFFGWLGATFLPGGQGVLLGLVNCFVHMVMYSYYFVTIWNPQYKQNIWWKKHITQLQILQFLILVVHNFFLVLSPPCGYPKWTAFFIIPQFMFFLILFVDFYRKTYR